MPALLGLLVLQHPLIACLAWPCQLASVSRQPATIWEGFQVWTAQTGWKETCASCLANCTHIHTNTHTGAVLCRLWRQTLARCAEQQQERALHTARACPAATSMSGSMGPSTLHRQAGSRQPAWQPVTDKPVPCRLSRQTLAHFAERQQERALHTARACPAATSMSGAMGPSTLHRQAGSRQPAWQPVTDKPVPCRLSRQTLAHFAERQQERALHTARACPAATSMSGAMGPSTLHRQAGSRQPAWQPVTDKPVPCRLSRQTLAHFAERQQERALHTARASPAAMSTSGFNGAIHPAQTGWKQAVVAGLQGEMQSAQASHLPG